MGGKKREKIFFPETHVYRKQKTMENNRLEKCENTFFYKHTNIVIKKSEEKIARENFSINTRSGYPKNVGKNRLKKCENTFFYKQINIVTKKLEEKTRKQFFF